MMCGKLMHTLIKKLFLDSANTMYKIVNLDVLDKKNHKAAAKIDDGFSAKATIANLVKTKQ